MIDLYYWTTPNGHKITLFLEETGLKYNVIPINIGKGEQFKADFLKVSPNNRIPALVDHEPKGGGAPISVFESGAMLVYLAEKTGKFLPASGAARYDALQWLFWQMGGLGPMSGQNNHFSNYANDKIQYAMDRYRNEGNPPVPWERQGQKIDDFPNLKRWLDAIAERPATKKAYEIVKSVNPNAGGIRTEEEKRILFGQTAASIAAAADAARK